MSRGVHQLSRATWAWVHGPVGSTSCAGPLGPGFVEPQVRIALTGESSLDPMARVVDQFSRVIWAHARGPTCRPPVLVECGPGPSTHGFDQLSRGTRAQVRGPEESTSCPGGLGTLSEGPRCRQAFPGVSHLCPRARGFHQSSLATQTMPVGPGVEQLSWATPGRVQGPTGSTSCPGRLGPGSDFPRGRPAIPGDSGPCPRARGFDQLSRGIG